MAYTTTSTSKGSTVVGTSGADTLASTVVTTKTVQINSYEGADTVELAQAMTSGTVGMGGGKDKVTFSAATLKKNVSVTLGDAADSFTYYGSNSSTGTTTADEGITVGGQGGADTFTIDADATLESRFAGGQGTDLFTVTNLGGTKNTIVGGSEDDIFKVTAAGTSLFINGQKGADKITISGTIGANATIRGGSEADTIVNADVAASLYGDDGADKITDGSGASKLNGGGGKDTLIGGGGLDTYDGGEGLTRVKLTQNESGLVTDDDAGAIVIADFKKDEVITVSTKETIKNFGAGDVIDTANAAASNATTVATASGAFASAITYFAFGTYAIDGTFTVATTGDDAVVFTGTTGGTAGNSNAGDLSSNSWVLIDGGAANLTAASFV